MNKAVALDPKSVMEIKFAEETGVNTPEDVLLEQLKINITRGLPQCHPYELQFEPIVVVAGGPSLAMTEKELVRTIWDGYKSRKVVTVNGSYQWCIEHNIRPSVAVMMDAREFNARFFEEPVEGCHYLLASECHPKAFEVCRGRTTSIWHCVSAGEKALAVLDDYYFKRDNHHPVCLGTTVAVRAISLMRMLGFNRQHIFGLDSCWIGDAHHAYAQKENDGELTMPVWVRPKGRDDLAQRFICSAWQAKQAEDFMNLVNERGNLFDLNVHGPGLIATIIRTGAELEPEET